MTDTFTSTLTDALAPLLTPDTDPYGDHRENLTALGTMFEEVFSIIMDQGFPDDPDWVPGFGALLDVDTCPFQYLGFLSQFTGTPLPAGVDDPTAREMIRSEQGMQRGTPGAIIAATKRNLSGTQSVTLLERIQVDGTPSAYSFVLVVRPEEVIDINALTAAVSNVKPGGVMFQVVQTDGWTISEMEADYSTITLLEAAFPTISNLETDTP